LEVRIASVRQLADVVGGTSERLIALDIAAKLVVAIAALLCGRLTHKRLAPSSDLFEVYFLHAEEPKAARENLVGPQALLSLQFFLHVLHAGLFAIVLVGGAVQVPGVVAEERSPQLSIIFYIVFGAFRAAGVQKAMDCAVFTQLE
jgi:hypothetical protein